MALRPANPLRSSVVGWLASALIACQAGCVSSGAGRLMPGFVEPQRDMVHASESGERIKAADMLQLRLPDNSTITLADTYEVAADGSIEVSGAGRVQVAGKTLDEARQAVRDALAAATATQVAIEIERHDYHVVTITADGVQHITRAPLKGRVTVKDALQKTANLSSKVIWIARTNAGSAGNNSKASKDTVLAVDWEGIADGDSSATNYALLPGDFLFVADEPARGVGRLFDAITNLTTASRDPSDSHAGKSAP